MSELVQRRVTALAEGANQARLKRVMTRIVANPDLHARMVNTLARLEYVGVRKMLKSRRAERLDLDGLQHMLDEAVHALRLKKAATALAANAAAVATFSDADTLAGEEGEVYFQSLDRAAEARLARAALDESGRAEANYLLTSAAIEVRAQVFYPLYDSILKAAGAPFSVAAIMKDEDRHLEEMSVQLAAILPDWQAHLEGVLDEEDRLFSAFITAIEHAADSAKAAQPAA
jgi:hypothetical protein